MKKRNKWLWLTNLCQFIMLFAIIVDCILVLMADNNVIFALKLIVEIVWAISAIIIMLRDIINNKVKKIDFLLWVMSLVLILTTYIEWQQFNA